VSQAAAELIEKDELWWMPKGRQLMKGNHAVCAGAIRAGCTAYFGYPITPQNEAIEYMSGALLDVPDGVFIQGESEVASINMVMGAAGAGRRAMTSSSSPGISLKQEGISYLAGMEIPCLVMNVVRAGPGLGNIAPHQGDYFQSTRGGGHGDYRMLCLAPNSVQEMAYHASLGFELAFKYRNPALIVTDGVIGQMMEPVDLDAIPIVYQDKPEWAVGIKHEPRPNRLLNSINLDPEVMAKFHEYLIAKYDAIRRAEVRYEEYLCEDADLIVVAYGSVSRFVAGAIRHLREEGLKIGIFRPITVWPFPYEALAQRAAQAKALAVFEMSWGQLVEDVALSLYAKAPKPVHLYSKHGGMVFTPAEIADDLRRLYGNPLEAESLWRPH
jgi:2-oxoglutarate/2-oxoacid ferredoxin oxidoreductase subunit alpha